MHDRDERENEDNGREGPENSGHEMEYVRRAPSRTRISCRPGRPTTPWRR
jgi:hypothetical protein